MTYSELKNTFQELKRSSPREDLTAHIIFTEDSFAVPYPLLSRTYLVSSDNKAFWPNIGGYSIFAYCLDKNSDQGVRLDWYMADEGNAGGWKVHPGQQVVHHRAGNGSVRNHLALGRAHRRLRVLDGVRRHIPLRGSFRRRKRIIGRPVLTLRQFLIIVRDIRSGYAGQPLHDGLIADTGGFLIYAVDI